jgi:DNA replication protein
MTTLDHAGSFPGVPAGARQVALPAALLHQAVPQMDDPAELLVTLYAAAAVQRLRRFPRLLDAAALRAERPLIDALARFLPHDDTDVAFQRGLDAAVRRGTLLRAGAAVGSTAAGDPLDVLTLNSDSDRRSLERWQRGQLAAAPFVGVAQPTPGPDTASDVNVYALYEATIGPITPQIADDLAEAEGLYPATWISDAFREAAELNKRSWRYIQRILERWQNEGRDDGDATPQRHSRWRPPSQFDHLIQR